jgi:tetratricopeptide (TPR) repeat protein
VQAGNGTTSAGVVWLAAGCGLAALAVGQWVVQRPAVADLPREDVLSLLLGGAREAASLSLFDRADQYFHGGVTHEDFHGAFATAAKSAAPAATVDDGHDQDSAHSGRDVARSHAWIQAWLAHDPWCRLNAVIHPSEHRHLMGAVQEKEVIPWVWAAAKLDPHNVLAYTTGGYWLARRVGQPAEGVRFLEDGIRHNPENSELEFTRGEVLLNTLHQPEAAYSAFTAALRKWRLGTTPEEQDDNKFLKGRILLYLAGLEEKRGRPEVARQRYGEVLDYLPNDPAAQRHLFDLTPVVSPPPAPAGR